MCRFGFICIFKVLKLALTDTDKSASLTVRVKLLRELKSTFAGRPFHTLTTRSLKNVHLTRAEQQLLFLCNLKEYPLILVQEATGKSQMSLSQPFQK